MQHPVWDASVFVVVAILWATSAAGQQTPSGQSQQKADAGVSLKPIERFEGKAAFLTKLGRPKELHVLVRNWQIHGRQRIGKFPEEGFMIVHLHSGKVTTVIRGKEEKHSGDAFWTVPAGSSMSVEVTSESALLETMAVRKK